MFTAQAANYQPANICCAISASPVPIEHGNSPTAPPAPSSAMHDDGSSAGSSVRSAYQGVSYDRRERKWRVRISAFGFQHHVGRYLTEEAAAMVYDRIAYELYGDTAITNFGMTSARSTMCHTPQVLHRLRAMAAERGLSLPLSPNPVGDGSGKQSMAAPANPFPPAQAAAAYSHQGLTSSSSPPSIPLLMHPERVLCARSAQPARQALHSSGPSTVAHSAYNSVPGGTNYCGAPAGHMLAMCMSQGPSTETALASAAASQGAWRASVGQGACCVAQPQALTLLPAGLCMASASTAAQLQPYMQQQAPLPLSCLATGTAASAAGQPCPVLLLDGQGCLVAASWTAPAWGQPLDLGAREVERAHGMVPPAVAAPAFMGCSAARVAGAGGVSGAGATHQMALPRYAGAVLPLGATSTGRCALQAAPSLPPTSQLLVLAQQQQQQQAPTPASVQAACSRMWLQPDVLLQLQGGGQQPQAALADLSALQVCGVQAALPAAPGMVYPAPALLHQPWAAGLV